MSELRIYNWTSDEFVLLDWYNQLVTTGDHYLAFDKDLRYVSNFLAFFKPPQTLAFASDKRGMWFAFWLSPFMSGANFGLWVREDKRNGTAWFKLLTECFDESFKTVTVLIAVTKQDSVCAQLERLGAVRGMVLPAFWDGADAMVYSMTKDQWRQKNGRTSRGR